ncbi:MAG TPA: LPS export ABC transporter permease LptF, partial [Candidatus Binatia bacterium]|nr:LPS export ABC transporter permease LptF [Candidatus Binatia bacterium]
LAREMTVGFVGGLALFTFILLTARIIEMVDLVLSRGLPSLAVARLFALILPTFLELTTPVAALLGVLVAFGRFASDGETVAMRAAGISWEALLQPVVRFGVAAALATLVVATFVRPWANRAITDTVYELAKAKATAALRPRVFNSDFGGIVIYVASASPASGELGGILVADERDEASRTTVFAAHGRVFADEPQRRVRLQLRDGTTVTRHPGADSYDVTSFASLEVSLDVEREIRALSVGPRATDMPLDELAAALRDGESEAATEVHRKLAFAVAALVFSLLGVPLAATASRTARGRGLAISIGAAFFYYLLLSAGVVLAPAVGLPTGVGLWLPNLVFAVVAARALRRLARDMPPFPRPAFTLPARLGTIGSEKAT